jgi:hypothetical protein
MPFAAYPSCRRWLGAYLVLLQPVRNLGRHHLWHIFYIVSAVSAPSSTIDDCRWRDRTPYSVAPAVLAPSQPASDKTCPIHHSTYP